MLRPTEPTPGKQAPERWKAVQRIGFAIAVAGMITVLWSLGGENPGPAFPVGMAIVGVGMMVVLAGTLLAFRRKN